MKIRFLMVFLFLFLHCFMSAQEEAIFPKHRLGVAYLASSFTRPGAVLSHQYHLWGVDKTKETKKGKIKPRFFELAFINRLLFYNHKQNHLALMLSTGAQFSFFRKEGKFVSIGPQIGFQQRFLNEDTYTVNEAGVVERNRFSGDSMFTFGLQTRIGKNFSFKYV